MRRFLLMIVIILVCIFPVNAAEYAAPEAPPSARQYMPAESKSFGEDLWYILTEAVRTLQPDVAEAVRVCLSVIAVKMLLAVLSCGHGSMEKVTSLAGTLGIGILLLQPTHALIKLGTDTVRQLSEYGKLLLPVMAASLAAQGGTTASTGLYIGTAFFDAILTSLIGNIIVPVLYIYLFVSVAASAVGEDVLKNIKDFSKWLMTWGLKIIMYVFGGYMSITNVVAGTVDAATVKAAKITISGAVPVIGGILSDASETILVSAGIMKSAAGIYGLLAAIAMFLGPFLKTAVQYMLLKGTAAICQLFDTDKKSGLIADFSGAMGMVLAMTAAACLLQLISTACFLKGVS